MREAGRIAAHHGDEGQNSLHFQEISADGSLRGFFRIMERTGETVCFGVCPEKPEGIALAEAHAAMAIGHHLSRQGIQVPEILAADQQSGLILFEDCGDIRLHDIVVAEKKDGRGFSDRLEGLYNQVIAGLVRMQWFGGQEFERSWCYDTPEYDPELMIKRESEYFLHAFWGDLIGGEVPPGITEEFYEIAAHAANGFSTLFLHRDFQSRNIMVGDEKVWFIDFQGGRIGPPGYDIASLLIDPYSSLDELQQEKLLHNYIGLLQQHIHFEGRDFLRQYDYLALQRNLQIIGAFAFLYNKRGKLFFKRYIIPALAQLCRLLNTDALRPYAILRGVAAEGLALAKKHL